jgi:hypothetical protein
MARSPRGPGFLAPVIAQASPAQLDLSVGRPGPHAFAVRGTSVVAQELRPRDDPRPSHPASNVRDDREAPLISEAGRGETITDFRKTEEEYFSPQDWTADSTLNCFRKFDFSRTQF